MMGSSALAAPTLAMVAAATLLQAPVAAQAGNTYVHDGYRFDISTLAASPDRDAMLAAADRQVEIVEQAKLTPQTVQLLQSFTVHLTEGSGGEGHFGRGGVFVNLRPVADDRPILLHEFMHAFQNARLPGGVRNPDVLRFYAGAKSSGRWPAGAYMLKNPAEFFAMTASVYLCGHAARPPGTREALEAGAPEYAQWLGEHVR